LQSTIFFKASLEKQFISRAKSEQLIHSKEKSMNAEEI